MAKLGEANYGMVAAVADVRKAADFIDEYLTLEKSQVKAAKVIQKELTSARVRVEKLKERAVALRNITKRDHSKFGVQANTLAIQAIKLLESDEADELAGLSDTFAEGMNWADKDTLAALKKLMKDLMKAEKLYIKALKAKQKTEVKKTPGGVEAGSNPVEWKTAVPKAIGVPPAKTEAQKQDEREDDSDIATTLPQRQAESMNGNTGSELEEEDEDDDEQDDEDGSDED